MMNMFNTLEHLMHLKDNYVDHYMFHYLINLDFLEIIEIFLNFPNLLKHL